MSRIEVASNNLENIIIGKLRAKHSVAGDRILRFYIDLRHRKLDLYRELSAPEISILQSKVDALMAGWDKKWIAQKARDAIADGKVVAEELTLEAEGRLAELKCLLDST